MPRTPIATVADNTGRSWHVYTVRDTPLGFQSEGENAMRFIAERYSHGSWQCHAEDVPCISCGGPAPEVAFYRACKAYAVDPADYRAVERSADRVVFGLCVASQEDVAMILGEDEPRVCPECKGSGRYVGLNTIEWCGTCGGSGRP